MMYNTIIKAVKTNVMCITCKEFDVKQKQCNGIGKVCFEADPITKTLIDPVTRLAIKIEENKN